MTACAYHESDRVLTEVRIDANGYGHAITHCKHCGAEMSKPMKTTPKAK